MKTQIRTNHIIMHSLAALLLIFSLTACGKDFAAGEYVQSYLDAMTKGKFDTYRQLTQVSESTAKTNYQNRIKSDVNSMISTLHPDSATEDEFYTIFKDLYAKCKYEVGEAVKNDDNTYSVPVTAYKMNVFKNLMDETTQKSKKEAKKKGNVSISEVSKIYLNALADVLKEHLKNVEYAEPVKITVAVTPTQKNPKIYTLTDSECMKIFKALMDSENLQ